MGDGGRSIGAGGVIIGGMIVVVFVVVVVVVLVDVLVGVAGGTGGGIGGGTTGGVTGTAINGIIVLCTLAKQVEPPVIAYPAAQVHPAQGY